MMKSLYTFSKATAIVFCLCARDLLEPELNKQSLELAVQNE